jgi:glycosyltransferase involved in cell wall biosynthesis
MLAGRRPLAMSRVSLNWYHQKHRLFRIAELKFLHFCLDVAIGNSKAILKDLRAEGVPDPKLRLVYNGIDCAGFVAQLLDRQAARERMGVGAATLVLTSVANLHSYKGHADLLRALSLVRERLPADWALLIAGRDVDNNLAMLRTLSEELGISAHVRFLGERGDVPVILSAADIHVSASHTEGLPNNILEAMCAGLPIVATSVGGVPEQLIDREHGILVPPNDPGCLAAAIATLANDPAARSKLGGAARDRVERAFGIERAVVALEEVYGSLNARSGCIRSAG